MTVMSSTRNVSNAAPHAAQLSISSVSKSYGDVHALMSVSLTVPAGRIVGVLGPNGAGKSTLLHTACGLLEPDAGDVLFQGAPIRTLGPKLYNHLSCVLEDSALTYMFLPGWENLYYQGALYGLSRRRTRERCLPMIRLLGLERHMGKRVGDWSRGTQQKLALVTAMIPRPQVLILDEPTLGLDVVSKRDFMRTVRQLADEGTAVLLASHQSEVIEQLADDVLLIEHGHALWSGPYDRFIADHSQGGGPEPLETILLRIFDADTGDDDDEDDEDNE
ncbi:ABC transporter ATP-binding protein [Bifidobacterium leontopitheci]|uniref:Daunorubicin ABC transporter ATP-binding protein n=1 Tax=Bifidobacterium leontopitheci TaxID=2650774 RepID=A0A6I1GHU6_9BIFI|nr:ABC transporter ATP-binding protein [Bifidobacterium leontopitheci]KAB7790232.1 daunorubicin ABC transporter ATP-binding protein [Bifidobacterium leontopitheci]